MRPLKGSLRVSLVLLVAISILPIGRLPENVLAQSYSYVIQEMEEEAHVVSRREMRMRASFTLRNVNVKDWKEWTISVPGAFSGKETESSGYVASITRVYDSTGNLNHAWKEEYRTNRFSVKTTFHRLTVAFSKTVAPGETYRFSYEYTAKWNYDTVWAHVGRETSTVIEKIRLAISVSDQLRIARTEPGGVFSEDRKSAETRATNVKRHDLYAEFQRTSGKLSVLAVLVEFPDVKHHFDRTEISRRIFQETASYFKEVSFGQMSITGDTTDWIVLPKSASDYDVSKWVATTEKREVFALEVLKTADRIVDYSPYDAVCIVVAGNRTVHAFELWRASLPTEDGVLIERLTAQGEHDAVGTFAHEFCHIIGLDDLYDYSAASKVGQNGITAEMQYVHVGGYSLMSRSNPARGLLAWEKLTLGWIPSTGVRNLSPGETTTIEIHQLEYFSQDIMVVRIRISPKHYCFFEVRERTGYDSSLPRSGVLVTFVNEEVAGGYGPVRLVDANPSTSPLAPKGLDDAPFDLGTGQNSTFSDRQNGIGCVILQKATGSYVILFTKPESVNEAGRWAQEAISKIEQAEKEIAKARNEGRLEGLDEAAGELEKAKKALTQEGYREAHDRASEALLKAQQAKTRTYRTTPQIAYVIPVVIVILAVGYVLARRRKPTTIVAQQMQGTAPVTPQTTLLETPRCQYCGATMSADYKYCLECGKAVSSEPAQELGAASLAAHVSPQQYGPSNPPPCPYCGKPTALYPTLGYYCNNCQKYA